MHGVKRESPTLSRRVAVLRFVRSSMNPSLKMSGETLNTRSSNRPKLAHFLYEYLPLIDEHNKQRQSILGLERRWLTKCPWFRLLCTVLGMCTVDMHRLYRHHQLKVANKSNKEVDATTIIRFSDYICGNLRLWEV